MELMRKSARRVRISKKEKSFLSPHSLKEHLKFKSNSFIENCNELNSESAHTAQQFHWNKLPHGLTTGM